MQCTGTVRDMYNGNQIDYPLSQELQRKAKRRYDFHFTKHGSWFYSCSSDNAAQLAGNLSGAVVSAGEFWRVVDVRTSEIILTNVS